MKDKEGTGTEGFSLIDGVKSDADIHATIEGGSRKGRIMSNVLALEAAQSIGLSPAVAWALLASPELSAIV